jgi:hypothetical protein
MFRSVLTVVGVLTLLLAIAAPQRAEALSYQYSLSAPPPGGVIYGGDSYDLSQADLIIDFDASLMSDLQLFGTAPGGATIEIASNDAIAGLVSVGGDDYDFLIPVMVDVSTGSGPAPNNIESTSTAPEMAVRLCCRPRSWLRGAP